MFHSKYFVYASLKISWFPNIYVLLFFRNLSNFMKVILAVAEHFLSFRLLQEVRCAEAKNLESTSAWPTPRWHSSSSLVTNKDTIQEEVKNFNSLLLKLKQKMFREERKLYAICLWGLVCSEWKLTQYTSRSGSQPFGIRLTPNKKLSAKFDILCCTPQAPHVPQVENRRYKLTERGRHLQKSGLHS